MKIGRHCIKEVLSRVKARGWSAEITNGGHIRWRHRSGAFLFGSAAPGDSRSMKNLMAQMKRVEMRVV